MLSALIASGIPGVRFSSTLSVASGVTSLDEKPVPPIAVYDSGHIDALDEKHEVFRNPKTYRAALLTGCKNFSTISDLRYHDNVTTFYANDWGISLQIPGNQSGTMVGIRGHSISLSPHKDIDVYEMEITEVIEDTFEYVFLLKKSGFNGTPIHWIVSKQSIDNVPHGLVSVKITQEALMLLSN